MTSFKIDLHTYNVHHKVHVDFDLKWHGQEPTEMFEIYEKLGEGYGNLLCYP